MRGLNRYGPSVVVLIAACVVLLAGPMLVDRLRFAQEQASVQLARLELKNSPLLTQLNNSFQSIARAVEPSVVHITIDRERTTGVFGLQSRPSQGSGWVFDDRGHVVTNFHVIDGASRIEVRFADGLPHKAVLVGGDESTDIAVIRVDSRRVVPISRATGMRVRQGDLVFAFGSPFGFEFSMSSGIVSGHGRQAHLTGDGYENYIQTDAAINPGNSGGALVDGDGKLVGVNTAIFSRTGGNLGIGFAIPISIVRQVMSQIIEHGAVTRGWVGIEVQEITPEIAESFGLESKVGALIAGVLRNGPADRGGVRPGDVLVAVNGKPVTDSTSLLELIATLPPGQTAELQLTRDHKALRTEVRIEKRPAIRHETP